MIEPKPLNKPASMSKCAIEGTRQWTLAELQQYVLRQRVMFGNLGFDYYVRGS